MKRTFFAFYLFLGVPSAVTVASAQTIPNPSFESNSFTVFPGYASANGGSIAGWTLSPTTACGLNPASGNPFANNGAVPNGANIAFIQSTGGSNNAMSTTITGLTAGRRYYVSFRANARAATAIPNPSWSLNGGAFVPFTTSPAVGGGKSLPLQRHGVYRNRLDGSAGAGQPDDGRVHGVAG